MNNIEQTRLSSCGKVKQKIKNRGKEKEISIICITQDSSTNKKQKINAMAKLRKMRGFFFHIWKL